MYCCYSPLSRSQHLNYHQLSDNNSNSNNPNDQLQTDRYNQTPKCLQLWGWNLLRGYKTNKRNESSNNNTNSKVRTNGEHIRFGQKKRGWAWRTNEMPKLPNKDLKILEQNKRRTGNADTFTHYKQILFILCVLYKITKPAVCNVTQRNVCHRTADFNEIRQLFATHSSAFWGNSIHQWLLPHHTHTHILNEFQFSSSAFAFLVVDLLSCPQIRTQLLEVFIKMFCFSRAFCFAGRYGYYHCHLRQLQICSQLTLVLLRVNLAYC